MIVYETEKIWREKIPSLLKLLRRFRKRRISSAYYFYAKTQYSQNYIFDKYVDEIFSWKAKDKISSVYIIIFVIVHFFQIWRVRACAFYPYIQKFILLKIQYLNAILNNFFFTPKQIVLVALLQKYLLRSHRSKSRYKSRMLFFWKITLLEIIDYVISIILSKIMESTL